MTERTFWLNRTACDVLEEMRVYLRTLEPSEKRRAPVLCLLEELQIMFNKMEAALHDKRQIEEINEERNKLKKEYKALVKKYTDLGGEMKDD